MICAWKDLLGVLPEWMRSGVEMHGREDMQELRLRLDKPPEVIGSRSLCLQGRTVSAADLSHCIHTASRYSPWASESVRQGYLTTPGGHRIGICGQAVIQDGNVQGIRSISSLCIRVARDYPGISGSLWKKTGPILIIGSPGTGKTTLMRDLIRSISDQAGGSIGVVDERGEIFPVEAGFETGNHTDVLTGCGKEAGIDMLLRCMGPRAIAVDEITAETDGEALLRAGRCGVDLLATAHASNLTDLRARPIYRKLWEYELFQWIVILRKDKTWTVERMIK